MTGKLLESVSVTMRFLSSPEKGPPEEIDNALFVKDIVSRAMCPVVLSIAVTSFCTVKPNLHEFFLMKIVMDADSTLGVGESAFDHFGHGLQEAIEEKYPTIVGL